MVGGRIFGPWGRRRRRRRGFTGDFGWDGLLNFFEGGGVDGENAGGREEVGLVCGKVEVGKVATYLTYLEDLECCWLVVVVVVKLQRT